MSFLNLVKRLFERSTGKPAGVKYMPAERIRKAIERRNQQVESGDTAGYWKPTTAQLNAAKTGSFSLIQFVKKILDQGGIGSCTANGWAGAVALVYTKVTGAAVWLSRLYIYYYERLINNNQDADTGAEVGDGADVLSQRGAPLEADYPYADDPDTFRQQPPASLDAEASKYKIVNPMKVRANVDHIKAALKAGFPVVFGFEVYSSFESSTVARTGVVPMPKRSEQLLGGHCTYFIGYTDADGKAHFNTTGNAVRFHLSRLFGGLSHMLRRTTGFTAFSVTPPANCLISVNSWGQTWGDGGLFYLPVDFVSQYCADFYIFGDVTR